MTVNFPGQKKTGERRIIQRINDAGYFYGISVKVDIIIESN